MKRLSSVTMALGFILAIAVDHGRAAAPPNNDTSDANDNTAGGSSALGVLTTGFGNTAFGAFPLAATTTGADNSAFGGSALTSNVGGSYNTAMGASALFSNTSGSNNTAVGSFSLEQSDGSQNTAVGDQALRKNTTGGVNTAVGADALSNSSTGDANTAIGWSALANNGAGANNTASGAGALSANTTGSSNTAAGSNALAANTGGSSNAAFGDDALQANANGNANTAVGSGALSACLGGGNIAIGSGAGKKLTAGDNNIYIGNNGSKVDTGIIRIGRSIHTATFVAGIAGTPISGVPVVVNNRGRLGIQASSARYKRDIQPMGRQSEALLSLRPVTFRYKDDDEDLLRYGLVAEEVAETYPELVVRGRDGRIESVRYDELIAMLLNELQHARREVDSLKSELAEQHARDVEVATRLERLERAAGSTVALSGP